MLDPRKPIRGIRTAPILLFSVAVLASITILLSGCGEDDEPKDVVPPGVSFTSPTNESNVFGTVSIALDANDDKDLKQVEIFIDGVSATTITASPFEFSWDTNTVEDGLHTIKAVATDKTENTAESQIVVTVKNILIKIQVPMDQLYEDDSDYNERGFIFLSDGNGKVIISSEYQNGQEIIFKNPEFKGEKFYLTEVVKKDDSDDRWDRVEAITFTNVERGTTWIISYVDDDDVYEGDATLNYSNLLNLNSNYSVFSNGEESYVNKNHLSSVIGLQSSPSDIYITTKDLSTRARSHYGIFPNVKIGTVTEIDLSEVNKPTTAVKFVTPTGAGNVSLRLVGYRSANQLTNGIDIGSNAGEGELTYYYPGLEFTLYYSHLGWNAGDFYYSRGSREKLFDIKMLEKNVTFNFSNNNLTYTAEGEFDMTSLDFEDGEDVWRFYVSKGSGLVVPNLELPQAIADLSFPSFGIPNNYRIYEFEDIVSYSDFLKFYNSSRNNFLKLYADGKNFIDIAYYLDGNNGRKSTQDNRPRFRQLPSGKMPN